MIALLGLPVCLDTSSTQALVLLLKPMAKGFAFSIGFSCLATAVCYHALPMVHDGGRGFTALGDAKETVAASGVVQADEEALGGVEAE